MEFNLRLQIILGDKSKNECEEDNQTYFEMLEKTNVTKVFVIIGSFHISII